MDVQTLEWRDNYGTVWNLWCYLTESPNAHFTIHCFLKNPTSSEKGRKGEANFSLNAAPSCPLR